LRLLNNEFEYTFGLHSSLIRKSREFSAGELFRVVMHEKCFIVVIDTRGIKISGEARFAESVRAQ